MFLGDVSFMKWFIPLIERPFAVVYVSHLHDLVKKFYQLTVFASNEHAQSPSMRS